MSELLIVLVAWMVVLFFAASTVRAIRRDKKKLETEQKSFWDRMIEQSRDDFQEIAK
jgi:hypothetical protein